MYGYIYDIYLFFYLEVVKYVGKVKNKPCKSGYDWPWLALTAPPKQGRHFKQPSRLKHAYLGSNKHLSSKFESVRAKKYVQIGMRKVLLRGCWPLRSVPALLAVAIYVLNILKGFFIRALILYFPFFIPSINLLTGYRSGYVSMSLVVVTTVVSCIAVVCVSFEPRRPVLNALARLSWFSRLA